MKINATTFSKRRLVVTLAAMAGLALAAPAQAQGSYPNKPIRLVVGYSPGGAADIIARILAESLQRQLGQSVVVDNKPGASGNIGAMAVVRSPSDGYNLLFTAQSPITIAPSLYPKLPFDPVKDLVPVAAAARVLVFLEVRPSLQINDFKTFLDFIKANPGICPNCRSSGAVTDAVITFGLAPGYKVLT